MWLDDLRKGLDSAAWHRPRLNTKGSSPSPSALTPTLLQRIPRRLMPLLRCKVRYQSPWGHRPRSKPAATHGSSSC